MRAAIAQVLVYNLTPSRLDDAAVLEAQHAVHALGEVVVVGGDDGWLSAWIAPAAGEAEDGLL
jgi:hypothetical protein